LDLKLREALELYLNDETNSIHIYTDVLPFGHGKGLCTSRGQGDYYTPELNYEMNYRVYLEEKKISTI